MGWFRDKSPQRSVITDDTRQARETIEFEVRRKAFHHLCGLDYGDITPFIDAVVVAINNDYLSKGSTTGVEIRFPDILQPVADLRAFQNAFYPLVLDEIPEADRSGLSAVLIDNAYYLSVSFPEIAHQPA